MGLLAVIASHKDESACVDTLFDSYILFYRPYVKLSLFSLYFLINSLAQNSSAMMICIVVQHMRSTFSCEKDKLSVSFWHG